MNSENGCNFKWGRWMMELRHIYEPEHRVKISTDILNRLPEWFGIPEAKDDYIRCSSGMPFFTVFHKSKSVGFIAIKANNKYTAEIYVMGVHPDYHRRGIGRVLVEGAVKYCKENGYEFLQVKTLGESHPDIHYAGTRKFYEALGFKPLECLPELWGKDNPCLIMITYIA
jgi:GNAT superfamily N-acetyltransferase